MSAIDSVKRAIVGLGAQQAAHVANYANADTPGYKKATVDFETALRAGIAGQSSGPLAMKRTHHLHFYGSDLGPLGIDGLVDGTTGLVQRNDSNRVDVEQEAVEMARGQLVQSGLIQWLANSYANTKSAISGR